MRAAARSTEAGCVAAGGGWERAQRTSARSSVFSTQPEESPPWAAMSARSSATDMAASSSSETLRAAPAALPFASRERPACEPSQ